jgi:hypothetical protein
MDAPSVIGCTTRFINNVPCGTSGGKLEQRELKRHELEAHGVSQRGVS